MTNKPPAEIPSDERDLCINAPCKHSYMPCLERIADRFEEFRLADRRAAKLEVLRELLAIDKAWSPPSDGEVTILDTPEFKVLNSVYARLAELEAENEG